MKITLRTGIIPTGKITQNNIKYKSEFKGTNPALKKPSNILEIYAKMFARFH